MNGYVEVAVSSVREALLFNLVGAAIAAGALFILRVPLNQSFGFIILIESTGLMLIGGAMGVAGQATTRKVAELFLRRKLNDSEVAHSDLVASLYALTGGILFAEVFAMALILA